MGKKKMQQKTPLTKREADTLRQQLRQGTYEEAEALLKEHGEGVIVRPTAFGKTWLL